MIFMFFIFLHDILTFIDFRNFLIEFYNLLYDFHNYHLKFYVFVDFRESFNIFLILIIRPLNSMIFITFMIFNGIL